MKANIIYPTLVEQTYKHFRSMGIQASKDEIYKEMVSNGLIDQLGDPTPQAIKEGFVSVLNVEHKTLREFKNEFAVFKRYPTEEFYQADNIWYISLEIAEDVAKKLKKDKYNDDQFKQVTTYYDFRNYDDPKTIGEFKGINHPIYSRYDDEHFHLVDGKVCIDSIVVRDMANRVINGDIKGDYEGAKAILADLDNI